MFDKFNPTLSFAADPPEGGGGTKTGLGSGAISDLNTDPAPQADPPESGGGTESSTTSSASSTTTDE